MNRPWHNCVSGYKFYIETLSTTRMNEIINQKGHTLSYQISLPCWRIPVVIFKALKFVLNDFFVTKWTDINSIILEMSIILIVCNLIWYCLRIITIDSNYQIHQEFIQLSLLCTKIIQNIFLQDDIPEKFEIFIDRIIDLS